MSRSANFIKTGYFITKEVEDLRPVLEELVGKENTSYAMGVRTHVLRTQIPNAEEVEIMLYSVPALCKYNTMRKEAGLLQLPFDKTLEMRQAVYFTCETFLNSTEVPEVVKTVIDNCLEELQSRLESILTSPCKAQIMSNWRLIPMQ